MLDPGWASTAEAARSSSETQMRSASKKRMAPRSRPPTPEHSEPMVGMTVPPQVQVGLGTRWVAL
jgi:hypothetical protein